MRNIYKLSFSVLFVLFLLLPLSVYGADISAQITAAINEMPKELRSPYAKVGLVSIVSGFFHTRVELVPNGYENKEKFIKTFEESFNKFRELLWSVDLNVIRENFTDINIQKMVEAYPKHKEKFTTYSNSLSNKNANFRYIDQSVILKSQIYYSLLLLHFNEEQWKESKKFTHIWPFCD